MNRKQLVKTVIFLLILAAVTAGISSIMMPKWLSPCYETVTFSEFSKLEEDSVEVCVLGNSQIVYGISGMQLYEEHGISAYSFGSATQPMAATYAWLQECVKRQNIRLAVLDVSCLYENPSASQWRKALDTMRLSPAKLEVIRAYEEVVEDPDPTVSFFIPLIKYHTRWNELTKDDFAADMEEQPVYRGYCMAKTSVPVKLEQMAYDADEVSEDTEMIAYQKEYLDKIVSYCEEQGIELLLIKTPKDDWHVTKHTQVQAYAEEKGVPFLEFSSLEMLKELELDMERDFYDGEHMNLRGARKLTGWLGNYISEHYELTDFRDVPNFDDLGYEVYAQDALLYTTSDIQEYFANLNSDRYEVMIQLRDDSPQMYSQELTDALRSAGLTADLTQAPGQKYAAWISAGEVIYEEVSEENLNYPGETKDKTAFQIVSNFKPDTEFKMRMNYEDVMFSAGGLHVMVYDHVKHQLADKSTIYYNEETKKLEVIKETWSR